MTLRIEDYALIGDCETAALVGRDGSIDWLCWPRFDSDACFAALLGTEENGRWTLAPQDKTARATRRYRPDTLILETQFETDGGAVTLIDFMPPRNDESQLIRIIVGERGKVSMETNLKLRFGYGAIVPWVRRLDDGTLSAIAGPDMVFLRTNVELRGQNMATVGEFTVNEGDTVFFVMTYLPSHLNPAPPVDPLAELSSTENFWKAWSAKCHVSGPWKDVVKRSLITLKALTYAPTGGIVAAPTTSLPEAIGGPRNWDYRYCWLRDATLTLLTFMNTGYFEEASAWRNWLLRAVAGSPDQMQIMYGISGERRLTEWEVPWLAGYEKSAPVRVGNGAHGQLQLDVYGELMDALHQARQHPDFSPSKTGWAMVLAILAHLERIWSQPDEGIWEVRGGPRHFTYSKVMAWVAFDRAVRSAEALHLEGPVAHWRQVRDQIHDDVCDKGYDSQLGSFVQSYGAKELDASLLLIPAVGFLPPSDPRVQGTVAAVERELVRDGLVLRYDTTNVDDGLPAGEGAFLACSFWLADAYLMLGRVDDAQALFERLLSYANDLGLLAEEYDPKLGRQVGNFPQAFSHLAMVNTACNLGNFARPAEQRGGHQAVEMAEEAEKKASVGAAAGS